MSDQTDPRSELLVATLVIGNHTKTRLIFARDRELYLDEYPTSTFREATEEDVAALTPKVPT